jgi:hypothetical protein
MRKTNRYKKINGRKKRTLKMRGGDLDDPDTKEYLNSKFTALEQKITELENNMPVQIGYKRVFSNDRGMVPVWVNKNINIDNFMNIVDVSTSNLVLFLNSFYSLPKLRGLNIDHFKNSPHITFENKEDQEIVKNGNVDALNAKYPGLFVVTPSSNHFDNYYHK